jgi:hypothetical protein
MNNKAPTQTVGQRRDPAREASLSQGLVIHYVVLPRSAGRAVLTEKLWLKYEG